MSKTQTRNVSTTIREEDYQFLKHYNLHVSAALSIGIQTIKKMFINEKVGLSDEDIQLVNTLMDENRNVLRRLGEAD
jgi:post-segregation antitoxin (ccd killing protein)